MRKVKRLLDILVAAGGLVMTGPLLLLLAALVKLDSPGPVFYRARRVGQGGRIFHMLKLRTMYVDADRRGPAVTLADDPRITRVGRWLRALHLDELPQLWNVLVGDMSLVGPRPEDPRYVAHYTSRQRQVLSVRPGITGAAQLLFRREAEVLGPDATDEDYLKWVMPYKVEVDLDYIAHWSLWRDLGILWRTFTAVLANRLGRGSTEWPEWAQKVQAARAGNDRSTENRGAPESLDGPDDPEAERPALRSRPATPEDYPALRALLAEEYPDSDVGRPEFFHWQTEENPAGPPVVRLAVDPEGERLAGAFWLLPTRLQVDETVHTVGLIVNVVVRRPFRKQGLATLLGRQVFDDGRARGLPFTYAIPSPASYRLDVHSLRAYVVGRIPLWIRPLDWEVLLTYRTGRPRLARALARPLARLFPPTPPRVREGRFTLRPVERFGPAFDRLWARSRHKRRVVVVREAAWLNWRYLHVPTRRYRPLAAWDGEELVGYIVTRKTTLQGVQCGMIVDLWVEPTARGEEAAFQLVAEATARFVEERDAIAGALMLPGTPEHRALRRARYVRCPSFLEPQPIPLTFHWHGAEDPPEPITRLEHWFFTMGDYDVI